MGAIVVDIETVERFNLLPVSVQQYLIKREERYTKEALDTKAIEEKVTQELSLNPAAGTIASIGMYSAEGTTGAVLVNSSNWSHEVPQGFIRYDDHTAVFYGTEAEILQAFWDKLTEKAGPGGKGASHPVITFNGRSFDGPFLMLRSAMYGISPSRNLVGYRYSFKEHLDLLEVLTFQGALDWKHRYSLDFWCAQFGIESPKQHMDGSLVRDVWYQGDLDALIRYSLADVKATAELYRKLKPLIESLG